MSRMKILNAAEQEQFESPPVFNSVERKQYFDFSSAAADSRPGSSNTHEPGLLSGKLRLLQGRQTLLPEPPMLATRPRLRRATAWVSARVDRSGQLFCNDSPSTRKAHPRLLWLSTFDSTAKSFVAGEIKDKDGVIDKGAPTELLKPIEEKAVLGSDRNLRVSLYKALLFIHVMGAIKSGTLNLEHSYKYRTLDNYMIDRDRWQREKQTLLARAGLASFAEPKQVLDELDRALHAQYTKTNMNLVEGNNSRVKLNKDNTLTISTPKVDDADAAPLQTFFPERDYISLLEVLSTVNRYSGFLDEFQHWQQRYHRPKPPQKTFYAGIIGLGCRIGTRKIARISRQISEPELENTVNWYFSPDATQAANDKVLRLMDRMELPNRYRRSQEVSRKTLTSHR